MSDVPAPWQPSVLFAFAAVTAVVTALGLPLFGFSIHEDVYGISFRSPAGDVLFDALTLLPIHFGIFWVTFFPRTT